MKKLKELKPPDFMRYYLPSKIESISINASNQNINGWYEDMLRVLVSKGSFKSLKIKSGQPLRYYFVFNNEREKPTNYLEEYIRRLNKLEELSLVPIEKNVDDGALLARRLQHHKWLHTINIQCNSLDTVGNRVADFFENYDYPERIRSLNLEFTRP
mmetsp:Transcript_4984/g.4187  ORF Transcript_4984/g.4187 Transcript_4984/m.4187 type:complete len:157 (+) Transcript_4984:479-949(+)